METFDYARAIRLAGGEDKLKAWMDDLKWTDDCDLLSSSHMNTLNTPQLRAEWFERFRHSQECLFRRVGSVRIERPLFSIFMEIEYHIGCIENRKAIMIQKWVRGVLTRSKMGLHNPHCEMGQLYLRKMWGTFE
jgi:hypothetical protein